MLISGTAFLRLRSNR
ncbi:erythromycin resistance leader peptide [Corynebacterium phoceense]|uniref:Erm(X) leader peptide n=1 Tax=Trueperella pyogenes TaxID=1661 RepID=Q6X4V0_9ACTO|nr:Erm(X) leader peptide [Trueperella pyogenes]HAT1549227.1 erythromycin resistance leader peptide [Corynebacterium striatum]HDM1313015.1 erythromycin resistance leader peptide [Staphylococcus aureus]QIU87823.1 erythromycin resistance leader peptide [Trueperella pyogenes]QIU87825.1 erythromycin resistance leader peptide [Trueperella pyogenes]